MIKRNILLNPGPATTTDTVKMAQVVPDICHREKEFGVLIESITNDLTKIAGGDDKYTTILFGGSGTAAMESTITSVVSPNEKILIINNGAYGKRMVEIAKTYSISFIELFFEWGTLPDLKKIENILKKDKKISSIAIVHHETTTGILNPIKEVGKISKKYGCIFILDAISSFAGIDFTVKKHNIDFMMATSNKCIQGMPGVSFLICKKSSLEDIKKYPKRSFYLDLYSQHEYFLRKKQMEFTPPIQTIYALRKAIDEFLEEGAEKRQERYLKNWKTLVHGMKKLGFKKLLKDENESHMLTTFFEPEDKNYNFNKMHDLLKEKGFTIYPGKMEKKNTFRVANIGAIDHNDINDFLKTLDSVLKEMNIKSLRESNNREKKSHL